MRCFLALRPANHVREHLATIQDRLRSWGMPARWPHPEDLHCTLLFLGECDEFEVASIPFAIDDVASACEEPRFHLPGLGAFGGKTQPKIVYAALKGDEGLAHSHHLDLADCLGIKPKREFLPHITMARPSHPKGPNGRSWHGLLEAYGQATWGPCPMSHLVLYESRRDQTGSHYHELESWPLLKGAEKDVWSRTA